MSLVPSRFRNVEFLKLKDEPYLIHDLIALLAGVAINRSPVGLVAVAHDNDVFTAAEGIGVDGLGVEDHFGVLSRGLIGGGAIEVPLGAECQYEERRREGTEYGVSR